MVAAGLLAKKAVEKGLNVPPYVKTSLAPGSRVVTDYLDKAGLDQVARKRRLLHRRLRLHDLHRQQRPAARADRQGGQRRTTWSPPACSRGNRNFEGRINPAVKANYLASPPLVVAYALAGTTDIDFDNEPLGTGNDGQPVYLEDIWPTHDEVQAVVDKCVLPEMFQQAIRQRLGQEPEVERHQDERRRAVRLGRRRAPTSRSRRSWSTCRRAGPDPADPRRARAWPRSATRSRPTTSRRPARSPRTAPPASTCIEHGVEPRDFNSYGARRGNDRVMTRGTFANIRIRNLLAPGTEGGVTRHLPDGAVDVDLRRRDEVQSRRRAAGRPGRRRIRHRLQPRLGRQRAVPAGRPRRASPPASSASTAATWSAWASCRWNSPPGQTWQSLGLTGEEVFDIPELDDNLQPAADDQGRRHRPPTARTKSSRCYRAHRHARRARLLPQRRHPADRAAEAAEER